MGDLRSSLVLSSIMILSSVSRAGRKLPLKMGLSFPLMTFLDMVLPARYIVIDYNILLTRLKVYKSGDVVVKVFTASAMKAGHLDAERHVHSVLGAHRLFSRLFPQPPTNTDVLLFQPVGRPFHIFSSKVACRPSLSDWADVLLAANVLHSHGLVHSDFKPENLFHWVRFSTFT